jgi:integrative and conjugative element protein (TIGR02256 family)
VIAASAEADLRRYAEAKVDRETGGALIGSEAEGGHVVVLEVTDAGPKAQETRTRFLYDPDHVNAWLADAAQRLGSRGAYVGEWHTHLERDPQPSARDVASLSAIAEEPQYLSDEPVLLIGGVDPTEGRVATIHASCFPYGRAMREIGLEISIDSAAQAVPVRLSHPG